MPIFENEINGENKMTSGIMTEIQSAGGGYGGFGNGGTNPLLWLITLAFLRNGEFGNNGNVVETAQAAGIAKANEGITCLAQGQAQLANQQQFDRIAATMDATGNRTVSAIGDLTNDFNSFSRDLNMTLCNGFNDTQIRNMQTQFDLSRQVAECCCDLKAGQNGIETAICNQTNTLLTAGTANTQRIVDLITANKIQELESQLNQANTAIALNAQTRTLEEFLVQSCGCGCPQNRVIPTASPVPAPAG